MINVALLNDWPPMVEHLSATQVGMYTRCPEQYRQRYILGIRERPGASRIWGAADHKAHELNLTQKIDTHEDLPVAEVQDAFRDAVLDDVDHYGADYIEWGGDTLPHVIDVGTRVVAEYMEKASPHIQPVAVEQEFTISMDDVPVPLVGRIDVVTEATGIERKTSKATQRKPKPDWLLQGRLYQAVHNKPVEWHVAVKKKQPVVITPADEPDLRLLNANQFVTMRMVQNAARGIRHCWTTYGAHQPWPDATSHPWACGTKENPWCAYRRTCFYWT